jgi:ribosomal protein S21
MGKNKALVSVKVIKGDINRALKKFKRSVMDSGHLLELRERKEYTKPKTVRRKQKLQAIREQQRKNILERIESGDKTLMLNSRKKKKNKSSNVENKNKSNEN